MALRAEGYNCSQCVAMVFDDLTGVDKQMLARATAALGGGVAGMREVCGAVTAMGVVDGLMQFNCPTDKKAVYSLTSADAGKFRELNGSIICRELKSQGAKPCQSLIADAITILYNRLSAEKK